MDCLDVRPRLKKNTANDRFPRCSGSIECGFPLCPGYTVFCPPPPQRTPNPYSARPCVFKDRYSTLQFPHCTMHSLDQSVRLMSLRKTSVVEFPYLLLNMFRILIHPSSGACDLFDALLRGLYCSVRTEVDTLA